MSPTVTNFFYFILSPVLGKKVFQYFFEKMYLFSLAGMNYGHVIPSKSGEVNVLKFIHSKLASKRKIVILDVGANKGEFTRFVLKIFGKNAYIYAIEPLSAAVTILKKKFAKENVKIFHLGLSDKIGKTFIYFNEESSELASLYKREIKAMSLPVKLSKKEVITLTTIDKFCKKNGINKIDFLKIDTEGNELKILVGSSKMLKENRIGYIQFEFGGTMIDSRTFFRDIYQLLNPNFKIYQILQDGIREIKQYSEKQEIFIVSNFLAINRNLS